MVGLSIEFLKSELNFYSLYEFLGKQSLKFFLKLCLDVEFLRLKSIVF
jgi:hypothetical protein